MKNDQIDLDFIIAILVSITMIVAQFIYIKGVIQFKVKPSVFSWFGWSLLMGITLFSQIIEVGWDWSHSGILVSTIGCLTVGIVALSNSNFSFERSDPVYLILGFVCFVVYLASSDPWITTILAVISDLIIGIPTIIKAIKTSRSERSPAWIIGFICWTLTLLVSFKQDIIYSIFPLYLFLFSGMMIILTRFRTVK